MTDRPLRFCDLCGGLDDHPRHVIAVQPGTPDAVPSREFLASLPDGPPVEAIALLLDEHVVVRHIDCCAIAGCEVCQATETATAGERGLALLDAIQLGALDDVNTDGLSVGGLTNG